MPLDLLPLISAPKFHSGFLLDLPQDTPCKSASFIYMDTERQLLFHSQTEMFFKTKLVY